MEDFLKVYSVSKSYRHGKRKVQNAVSGVSFTLEEGRCLGLVGESGCGKSTFCRLIAGVEQPSGGEILYQGESNYLKKLRGQIQMVFQNSLDAVNLHLNVFRIIEEPLENFSKLKRQERRERVGELLETVGLSKEDMDKYPQQFSGGQLQRICIARALAANPKLLLLDEPLSSLDVSVQAQLLNLLSDLKKDWNLTCILVSHDLEAVYYLADEIVVMYGGCLVEQIRDIRDFPALRHPYTRSLLAAHKLDFQDGGADVERTGEERNTGCVYAAICPYAKEKCFQEIPLLREWEKGHSIACHFSEQLPSPPLNITNNVTELKNIIFYR